MLPIFFFIETTNYKYKSLDKAKCSEQTFGNMKMSGRTLVFWLVLLFLVIILEIPLSLFADENPVMTFMQVVLKSKMKER